MKKKNNNLIFRYIILFFGIMMLFIIIFSDIKLNYTGGFVLKDDFFIKINDIKIKENILDVFYSIDSYKIKEKNISVNIRLTYENQTIVRNLTDNFIIDNKINLRNVRFNLENLPYQEYVIYISPNFEKTDYVKEVISYNNMSKYPSLLNSTKNKLVFYFAFLSTIVAGVIIIFFSSWNKKSKSSIN